jgi:hypothetical protein
MLDDQARGRREERIDVKHEYELCAWARHFNASEQKVKEAVAAVGDRAEKVREHLFARGISPGARVRSDRPSGNA